MSNRVPRQSTSELSKIAEVLGIKLTAQKEASFSKKEEPSESLREHQVLPIYRNGLGGSGTTSLPAGFQHADASDPSEESQLSALGLQL